MSRKKRDKFTKIDLAEIFFTAVLTMIVSIGTAVRLIQTLTATQIIITAATTFVLVAVTIFVFNLYDKLRRIIATFVIAGAVSAFFTFVIFYDQEPVITFLTCLTTSVAGGFIGDFINV